LTDKNFKLKVCRDIANCLKHLKPDRAAVSDQLGLHSEYDHFRGKNGEGCEVLSIAVYGVHNQNERLHENVVSLAEKMMGLWGNCLRERHLAS
jgi:hypothetical protein